MGDNPLGNGAEVEGGYMQTNPTKQYRLMRWAGGWQVLITHEFLDTEYLAGGRVFAKQAEARAYAKAHAERTGVRAIILT